MVNKGELFFTVNNLMLNQKQTQSNAGGMTETYIENGTYIKSFYSVMYCPSFVKVDMMRSRNSRLHHRVNWNNAVPLILSENYKKI